MVRLGSPRTDLLSLLCHKDKNPLVTHYDSHRTQLIYMAINNTQVKQDLFKPGYDKFESGFSQAMLGIEPC